MKIAIVGANGYLGKNTIQQAIERGWHVHAIIRREEIVDEIKKLGASPFLISQFDKEQYKIAFSNCIAIIHFANIVCGSREEFSKVNIEGLKVILEAAQEMKVKRIIYPSGLGVDKYGKAEWAKNDYFWSKYEAEKLIKNSQLTYAIFRPSYILGPGDELIPEILEQILDGKVLIAGEGDIPMQPIYVKNAIRAFLNAAEGLGNDNTIYNLVGPTKITMRELVLEILSVIKNIGLSIPEPAIEYISYKDAPEKLGICKDMVDVMKCDIIEDGYISAHLLNYTLSSLTDAIEAAVKDKLIHQSARIKKRAIILLSGGIDSTTTLYWAKNEGFDLIALTFNYKWRAKKEIIATKTLSDLLKVPLIEVPTLFIEDAVDLRMDGFPVPSATNAPQGYIPLRNLVFYSIAAYYAVIYDCQYIIGGHIKEDLQVFNDTTSSFFRGLKSLIQNSRHKFDNSSIDFLFPLLSKTKNDVIKMAKELKVPLELTWSCYGDYSIPCGRCKPCLNRKKALDEEED